MTGRNCFYSWWSVAFFVEAGAQSLTLSQRSSLTDLLQLVGGESSSKYDLVRERECIHALVDAVDVRFTKSAPRELRSRFCVDDDAVAEAPEREVDRVLDSVARQILRADAPPTPCAELELEASEYASRVRRVAKTMGRACLLGSGVNEIGRSILTSHDDVASRLTRLLARDSDRLPSRWTKDAFFLSVVLFTLAIGALIGVRLNVGRQRDFEAAAEARREQKQLSKKKCSCALCEESVTLDKMLGEGGFGTVYKCGVAKEWRLTHGAPGRRLSASAASAERGGRGGGFTASGRSADNVIKMIAIDLEEVRPFIYRYIIRESCSQFDSLPLTSLLNDRPRGGL
jgi:hypothetical protein